MKEKEGKEGREEGGRREERKKAGGGRKEERREKRKEAGKDRGRSLYLSIHRDAKPLWNVTDPDRQSGTTGYKPQKHDPFIIRERLQCLP